jgi:hypothetical protein
MRVAKDPDHLKLRAGVKQTLEQAHSALDAYFEFFEEVSLLISVRGHRTR